MGDMRALDAQEDVDLSRIDAELKQKYPGVKLFHLDIPYVGHFYIRGQNQADVKLSTTEAEKFIDQKIAELGGHEKIKTLPEGEQTRLARETDIAAGEISNMITLSRCVVYPYTFATDLKADKIMSGALPTLLDKIMDISGWMDVRLREV